MSSKHEDEDSDDELQILFTNDEEENGSENDSLSNDWFLSITMYVYIIYLLFYKREGIFKEISKKIWLALSRAVIIGLL